VFMNLRQMYADWLRGCGRTGPVAYSEAVSVASLIIFATLLWDGSVLAVAWAVSFSAVASLACLVLVGVTTGPAPVQEEEPINGEVQACG